MMSEAAEITRLNEEVRSLKDQLERVKSQQGKNFCRASISYGGKDIKVKVKKNTTSAGLEKVIRAQFDLKYDDVLSLEDSDGDFQPIDCSLTEERYTLKIIREQEEKEDLKDSNEKSVPGYDRLATADKRSNPGSVGFGRTIQLAYWDVDDNEFWEREGKSITNRNLLVSGANLLMAHGVWTMWAVVVVKLRQANFNDPTAYTFSDFGDLEILNSTGRVDPDRYRGVVSMIPACAGLAGGIIRVANTFMVPICGGQFPNFFNSFQLLLVTLIGAIALKDPNVSFWTLWFIAVLSGVGGGCFASNMASISQFYPKREQGKGLGLNAGMGNVGVFLIQKLCSIVMGVGIFGGTAIGGQYIANAPLLCFPMMVVCVIPAWFWLNDMPKVKFPVPRNQAIKNFFKLHSIVFFMSYFATAMFCLMNLKPLTDGARIGVILFTIVLAFLPTCLLVRYKSGGEAQKIVAQQFSILGDIKTHHMAMFYLMTFGSFIGFANSFPQLIVDIFGFYTVDGVRIPNPNAPVALDYAPWGSLIAALIRAPAGIFSDKVGAAIVLIGSTIGQLVCSIIISIICFAAYEADDPSGMFSNFCIWFYVLFFFCGIGNGAVYKLAADVFPAKTRGAVLGWISMFASFGCFLIPALMAVFIKMKMPSIGFLLFSSFYGICLFIIFFRYLRPKNNASVALQEDDEDEQTQKEKNVHV